MTSMSHVTGEPTLPTPAASLGGCYRSITAGPSGQKGSEVHIHDGGPHLTSSGDPGSCWAQTAEGGTDGPSPRRARRVCSGENCGAGSERLGRNRAWACPGPCPLQAPLVSQAPGPNAAPESLGDHSPPCPPKAGKFQGQQPRGSLDTSGTVARHAVVWMLTPQAPCEFCN